MSLRDDGETGKLPRGDPRLGQATGPISSLNEAWFHTLDSCVVDGPLSDVILPLMRNCFFAGATYAVLLLQRGHGDHLARDIAGFGDNASPPSPPNAL
jgi:hypothetical protein